MPDTRRELSALQTAFADNSSGNITAQNGRDAIISMHGSKAVQSDVVANLPASGQVTGDLYLPTDCPVLHRWDGSAWDPRGPVYPLTDPTLQSWSWLNQGSASLVTTGPLLTILDSSAPGSWVVRARSKAQPSTPYTITAGFIIRGDPVAAAPYLGGLGWYESGTGKLIFAGKYAANGYVPFHAFAKLSSLTGSFSAFYDVSQDLFGHAIIWMQIRNDGTNLSVKSSHDGVNFIQNGLSRAVGDFFTTGPDTVMWCLLPFTTTAAITLFSWKEGS